MSETRELIMEMLMDMHPEVDFDKEDKLVANKILDSYDLVSLVSELSGEFGIEIKPKDFVEENFNSLDALTKMVDRLVEE